MLGEWLVEFDEVFWLEDNVDLDLDFELVLEQKFKITLREEKLKRILK